MKLMELPGTEPERGKPYTQNTKGWSLVWKKSDIEIWGVVKTTAKGTTLSVMLFDDGEGFNAECGLGMDLPMPSKEVTEETVTPLIGKVLMIWKTTNGTSQIP